MRAGPEDALINAEAAAGIEPACTLNIEIVGEILSGFADFLACHTVRSAHTRVVPRGRVTFRSGHHIVLENGFSVEGSAEFVAALDAKLNQEPIITSDGGGERTTKSLPENTTFATDVNAFDPEGETEGVGGLTYSLSGSDAALFSIGTNGVVAFRAAPDFEGPGDINFDNAYEFQVAVSDSAGLTDRQDITVEVIDVNEPPIITSGAGNTAVVSVPENRSPLWAHALGGQGIGITLDASGNLYFAGVFSGTVDFDPGPGAFYLTSAGFGDAFVSKLDRDGNFIWAAAFGGTRSEKAFSVTVDGSGNVYTAGNFDGTADFDPGPGTFTLDAAVGGTGFVSKLDRDGRFLWAVAMGQIGRGVAVDSAGNVYTIGHFTHIADFDPGPGTFHLTAAGGVDAFVSKLDHEGSFVWARAFAGENLVIGSGLAIDGADNIYAIGSFWDTVDLDPGSGTFAVTSAGARDVFLSKLDTSGNLVWARTIGAAGNQASRGVTVDSLGNVYTTGSFYGTVDFDPGPAVSYLSSTGSTDAFVTKFDGTGRFIWARGFGGIDSDQGSAVAVDNSSNVYIAGRFRRTADFDPGPGTFNQTSAGSTDAFVLRLNGNGDFVWGRTFGSPRGDLGWDVAVDALGEVYATGYFNETVDFDPGPGVLHLTTSGSGSGFICRLGGGGVVADVDSTDPEGETERGGGLTYALTDNDGAGPLGSDNDRFTVGPSSGLLVFDIDADFEAPGDSNSDNSYEVQVTVMDSGFLLDRQDVTVTVTDVND